MALSLQDKVFIYGINSVYFLSITKSSISNNTFLFNFFANVIASSTFSVHGHLKNINYNSIISDYNWI